MAHLVSCGSRLSRAFTFIFCLAGGSSARAAADDPSASAPLLVVVETGPGAGCDAAAVRAAIAAELHAAVVAPAASPVVALAGPRTNTLLVSIDHARIVVTLRGRGDEDLTRSVAAPADRAARLRVVAWLAGNVARDQLATLALPAAPVKVAAPAESAPAAPVAATELAAPTDSSTAPPVFRARPSATIESATTLAPAAPPESPRWTFSLSGGPILMFDGPQSVGAASWNLGGQIEGHRHRGRWFLGGALDVGPRAVHPIGGALLIGAQQGVGKLRLEGSVGIGVEALRFQIFPPTSSSGPSPQYFDTKAAGYGRAALAATYPVTPDLDVLGQLTGHLAATSRTDAAFVIAAFGLRVRFP